MRSEARTAGIRHSYQVPFLQFHKAILNILIFNQQMFFPHK